MTFHFTRRAAFSPRPRKDVTTGHILAMIASAPSAASLRHISRAPMRARLYRPLAHFISPPIFSSHEYYILLAYRHTTRRARPAARYAPQRTAPAPNDRPSKASFPCTDLITLLIDAEGIAHFGAGPAVISWARAEKEMRRYTLTNTAETLPIYVTSKQHAPPRFTPPR